MRSTRTSANPKISDFSRSHGLLDGAARAGPCADEEPGGRAAATAPKSVQRPCRRKHRTRSTRWRRRGPRREPSIGPRSRALGDAARAVRFGRRCPDGSSRCSVERRSRAAAGVNASAAVRGRSRRPPPTPPVGGEGARLFGRGARTGARPDLPDCPRGDAALWKEEATCRLRNETRSRRIFRVRDWSARPRRPSRASLALRMEAREPAVVTAEIVLLLSRDRYACPAISALGNSPARSRRSIG